ncbi:MAG: minor capsid protein, partial [Defluviitaleaceae bacterium]|nr:minor capsid protein [Defluviitaleaceae bacterium]
MSEAGNLAIRLDPLLSEAPDATSEAYWRKRALRDAAERINQTEDWISSELSGLYGVASREIEQEIEAFYEKYAGENGITVAEARHRISTAELNGIDFETLARQAMDTGDEYLSNLADTLSYQARISRLDALNLSINNTLSALFSAQETGVYKLLADTYLNASYRFMYNTDAFFGFRTSFAAVPAETVYKAVTRSWYDGNFSTRIWGHREQAGEELRQEISKGIAKGSSVEKMTKDISRRMDVSQSNARRLVRTETNHIHNQATMDGYRNYGSVEKYKYLATLDFKTSQVCRALDGEIFPVSKQEAGFNSPPMHPNCRSTTVPYFDGQAVGRRIARAADGHTYYVPDNMTYSEWWASLSDEERAAMDLERKKAANYKGDAAQWKKYRHEMGNEAPKSIEELQKMKYTDPDKWKETKSTYLQVNRMNRALENRIVQSEHSVPPKLDNNKSSVVDNYKNGKLDQRRFYNATGNPWLDIDMTDHGNQKMHPIVPHAHDLTVLNGKLHQPGSLRALTRAEK